MPVLVALPLWAALYPGAFGNHQKAGTTDPLVIGEQVYHSAGCSGCHGADGEGGVGPALHGGQSKLTFPNVADQIKWVQTGSQGLAPGTKYGDPATGRAASGSPRATCRPSASTLTADPDRRCRAVRADEAVGVGEPGS